MSISSNNQNLARWCVILAVVAGVLVLLTATSPGPVTPVDSVVDAVRFVVAVAAAMGAAIMVIERRIVTRAVSRTPDQPESGPSLIIDLRDRGDHCDQSLAARVPQPVTSEATATSI